jgi:hypothetical protein
MGEGADAQEGRIAREHGCFYGSHSKLPRPPGNIALSSVSGSRRTSLQPLTNRAITVAGHVAVGPKGLRWVAKR